MRPPSLPASATRAAAMVMMLLAGDAASQSTVTSPGQTYPVRPIRLVLPVAPGGTSDTLARMLGPRMSERLGQAIVVDNRPGAGGNIAAEIVAKAAPDGYTLFMGQPMLTTYKSLYSKLAYDPIKDFASIALLGTGQYILVVNASVPAKSVTEFIALAKASPGKLHFGSPAIGSASHLAGELLKSRAGIDMVHVAYKGGALATIAVLSGEIQFTFGTVITALPNVKAGKVRALAVTALKRSPVFPELPTLDESGFPGFNVTTWDSFVAPAATPPAIVARLNAETVKAAHLPEIRERIRSLGYEPAASTPKELTEFMRSESAIWDKVIRNARIKLD